MNTEERARMARRLRDDEAFVFFTKEFREDCIAAFTDSGAKDSERREEAHTMLRALSKLCGKLDAAVAAQTRAEKAGSNGGRGQK